ncbi:MAG: AAA family ATPase, partial [Planctomycetia bacterium]|nr:AAA family ATPase [Planctomycetia bacterium]
MDPLELLTDLARPEALPEAGPSVDVRQTHISLVFLTGDRVYKVKKTLALWGVLDYSTLEARRRCCEEEVRINRRLAPDVYLGVAPVVRRAGRLVVGDLPRPVGDPTTGRPGDSPPVDWAVVMRRLRDDDTLAHRIATGVTTPAEVEDVGRLVAAFHAGARTTQAARIARPIAFARILRQNFLATRAESATLGPSLHAWLDRRVARLLRDARATIVRRHRAGVPVDGHGDLRAEHVVRDARPGRPPWLVIDGIEFAPTLRCIDPLSDAAFLAMDLASLGRRDLADAYLAAYLAARPDPDAAALLPLFLAYRAHVRAKVDAHRAGEPEIPAPDRAAALEGARRHLAFAWSYARLGTPPPLVLLAGPSGVGKSAVARALAPVLGAEVVSSDVERKRLAGLAPSARVEGPALEALYGREMSLRTYAALEARAAAALAAGRPVLLDATYLLRGARASAVAVARRLGCPAAVLSLEVAPEVTRARIEARAAAGPDPSEATWSVHLAQV